MSSHSPVLREHSLRPRIHEESPILKNTLGKIAYEAWRIRSSQRVKRPPFEALREDKRKVWIGVGIAVWEEIHK